MIDNVSLLKEEREFPQTAGCPPFARYTPKGAAFSYFETKASS